jgi:hypothetical protein
MPITPFLDILQFDTGTQRVITYAFGMTCMALRVKTKDPIAEQAAERISTAPKTASAIRFGCATTHWTPCDHSRRLWPCHRVVVEPA